MMNTLNKSAAVAAVALFAGKATSNEVCKHVVIDGYFNELFMQNGSSRNSLPVFREVDVNTGDWGAKHLVMSGTGYMYLYNSSSLVESETEWTMRFKDGSDRARVCNVDNWNRAYQGNGPPVKKFNDDNWAMLSGADAASKCIPFPGTIDGEKIPVTSPVVYGVGDCAQAVSMQYPNATGAQVDPWRDSRAVWTTNCYAVFGHTKTDEPNDIKAHRACFFKDTVRPGALNVNQFRVDTKGKKINNIQECVDAGKADVSAQNAQATGINFDSADGDCWYNVASETSYYPHPTQKHVVFAKPLAKPASQIKCCIKKCPTAA